jgi:hypothetical protein
MDEKPKLPRKVAARPGPVGFELMTQAILSRLWRYAGVASAAWGDRQRLVRRWAHAYHPDIGVVWKIRQF